MNYRRGPVILEFAVPGQPAGSGSKSPMPKGRMVGGRFIPVTDRVGRPVFYVKPSSEKTKPWMETVIRYAQKHWFGKAPLAGAVWVDVAFYELRPGSHFYHRKSGDVLKANALPFPSVTETHDGDKMRRAICDSLTQAKVVADDRRIVGGEHWKLYADKPPHKACAVIRLGLMEAKTVEQLGAISPPTQATLVDAA